MRRVFTIVAILALVGMSHAGVVGKDGQTIDDNPNPSENVRSILQGDWEYSTAGAMDAVPTTGGSDDGWGTSFIVSVTNTTGQDMRIFEFGFPCGGIIPSEWGVWLGAGQPAAFAGADFSGAFTALEPDVLIFPPTTYTYVDSSAANVVIPDGETFWFGYINPGVSGQIDANGTTTYSWYLGAWDADDGWGRTTVMQFKANAASAPTPTPDPNAANPVPAMSKSGIMVMMLLLVGVGVAILMRRQ